MEKDILGLFSVRHCARLRQRKKERNYIERTANSFQHLKEAKRLQCHSFS